MALVAQGNVLVQGVFPPGTFKQLGLSGNWYGALEWQYPPHQRQGAYEEEGRAVNTLKVALPCLPARRGFSAPCCCQHLCSLLCVGDPIVPAPVGQAAADWMGSLLVENAPRLQLQDPP